MMPFFLSLLLMKHTELYSKSIHSTYQAFILKTFHRFSRLYQPSEGGPSLFPIILPALFFLFLCLAAGLVLPKWPHPCRANSWKDAMITSPLLSPTLLPLLLPAFHPPLFFPPLFPSLPCITCHHIHFKAASKPSATSESKKKNQKTIKAQEQFARCFDKKKNTWKVLEKVKPKFGPKSECFWQKAEKERWLPRRMWPRGALENDKWKAMNQEDYLRVQGYRMTYQNDQWVQITSQM